MSDDRTSDTDPRPDDQDDEGVITEAMEFLDGEDDEIVSPASDSDVQAPG